jgi:hypothetical protein
MNDKVAFVAPPKLVSSLAAIFGAKRVFPWAKAASMRFTEVYTVGLTPEQWAGLGQRLRPGGTLTALPCEFDQMEIER